MQNGVYYICALSVNLDIHSCWLGLGGRQWSGHVFCNSNGCYHFIDLLLRKQHLSFCYYIHERPAYYLCYIHFVTS